MNGLEWAQLNIPEKVAVYDEVMNMLHTFRDQSMAIEDRTRLREEFFAKLPTEQIIDVLERETYNKMYLLFFNDWLTLDYKVSEKATPLGSQAIKQNIFELDEAHRFALDNLARSYVAPYRVLGWKNGYARLENLIVSRRTYVVWTGDREFMIGDILVTRLAPVDNALKTWVLREPWLMLLPFDEKLLQEDLFHRMKKTGFSKRQVSDFCKNYQPNILKMINRAIIEIDKEVAVLLDKVPFRPEWQEISAPTTLQLTDFFDKHEHLIRLDAKSPRYLVINDGDMGRLTFGYIILEDEHICICVPPREDFSAVLLVLGEALLSSETRLEVTPRRCAEEIIEQYNEFLIEDLFQYVSTHPDKSQFLLVPYRTAEHPEIGQARADFFGKLSLAIGRRSSNIDQDSEEE
ncbi:MAG: hypothetical protein ACM3UZ_16200 [Acidobacteriota bacterium]